MGEESNAETRCSPARENELMIRTFKKFLGSEGGGTAIEYALIAAFIGVGIIASLRTIAPELNDIFDDTSGALQEAR